MAASFYLDSISKSLEKLMFLAFGRILVVVVVVFFNTPIKKKSRTYFPAFGRILALVTAFSFFLILFERVFKIDVSSFWQDLGVGGCFLFTFFLIP